MILPVLNYLRLCRPVKVAVPIWAFFTALKKSSREALQSLSVFNKSPQRSLPRWSAPFLHTAPARHPLCRRRQ
jgi:hypothetical protein